MLVRMTGTPDPDDELMTIGQFSSLARISVRMLRHYDEHGVLAPACIDDANGYRRYSSAQLERAVRIRQLRDVGFGVPAIATLLTTQGTPPHAQALAMQREVLVRDLRVAQQRISLIDQLVATEEKPRMNVTITQKTYPAQTVVALRDVIPAYDKEGELWDRLTPELARQGIAALSGGSTNHDEGFKESDVDTSVWVAVTPGTQARPPLQVVEQPEQQVVAATLHGSLSGIGEAADRLAAHLAERGLKPAGPLSVRYLSDPSTTAADENVTELSFPVCCGCDCLTETEVEI